MIEFWREFVKWAVTVDTSTFNGAEKIFLLVVLLIAVSMVALSALLPLYVVLIQRTLERIERKMKQ